MATQRDLSLAYSPGVAVPVEAIASMPLAHTITRPRATWWRSFPTAPPFWAWAIWARWPPSR
jgi:hypothetical protein